MSDTADDTPDLPVLDQPAEPLPPVVETPDALRASVAALAAGTGPVAIDTERAHGYRYHPRAYLIQLRRAGSGTHLVDPIPFGREGLRPLADVLDGPEWILHAATQDLPCLTELGLHPRSLFDTELAGRLLHKPRVGLGPLIEETFGLHLRKAHSAADWSRRPLPEDWLTYAALDVELLVELRERMSAQLVEAGKDGWAAEEFAALVAGAGIVPAPRVDPWRRTSGLHAVRTPRGLAVVRELWLARDEIARRLDKAPSKIVPDAALSDVAVLSTADDATPTPGRLHQVDGFKRRQAKRFWPNWEAAIERAAALGRRELPPRTLASDAPPPPRTWERRHPEAHARWALLRDEVNRLAEAADLPAENLLIPDLWRRLAWEPPPSLDADSIGAFLTERGARAWQVGLVAAPFAAALATLG